MDGMKHSNMPQEMPQKLERERGRRVDCPYRCPARSGGLIHSAC
jgi:hypothetical protein